MPNQTTAKAVSESSANPSCNPCNTASTKAVPVSRPWIEADLTGIAEGGLRQRGECLRRLFALMIKEAFLCGAAPKEMSAALAHHCTELEAGRLEGQSLAAVVAEEAHPRFLKTKTKTKMERSSSVRVVREELQQNLLQLPTAP